MNNKVIIFMTLFMLPIMSTLAVYVQIHGDYTPGGGFQAGVIMATAFITYAIIKNPQKVMDIFSINSLVKMSSFGVLIYASTGVISIIKNKEFLNYSVLSSKPVSGQHIGILAVEAGVGITVFSTILLIFILIANRNNKC